MLSEFDVFPLGKSANLLQQQTRMQLDKGSQEMSSHHSVSLILKNSENNTDGHRLGSPFSFHCRCQTSMCFK